jgi:predicted tellurium resistance membrane protein TerC
MVAELLTVENLFTLMVLTALETVLGFDNLLYISIEAKRVEEDKQKYVRQVGIVLAIGLRIVLLFVVLQMISAFQSSLFKIDLPFVHADVSGHVLIVLLGGVFLMYTALKEIFHMLVVHDLQGENGIAVAAR